MVLKSVGIFLALYAALTVAVDHEFRNHEYHHRPYDIHRVRVEAINNEDVAPKWHGHHDLYKRHHSHNSKSGEWSQYGHNNHIPHQHQEFNNWNDYGYPKPYVPYHTEEFEGWEHHGFPNSPYPHDNPESIQANNHGLNKPNFEHFPEQLEAPSQKPYFSPNLHEQYWAHKVNHRPDWYNSHFPQVSGQTQNENVLDMERRRPLFYPIYPYHFYPHAHPSANDEEFETIEAVKSSKIDGSRSRRSSVHDDIISESSEQQKHDKSHHHGHQNPNFPVNPESSENDEVKPFGPLHHGLHYPHFYPFHKDPQNPEYGDDFPTSDEAQPYGLPWLSENEDDSQEPIISIEGEEGKFPLPGIILDILDHFHQGHGKPPHHGHKPHEEDDDEEGSGEEEIIPLSSETRAPLIEEDLVAMDK